MRFFSAQKLIALSLIIFLSSACCLLCCEMKMVAFSAAESCPLSKGGHHCPSQKSAETNAAQDGEVKALASVQTESHCPFISRRSEPAWKPAFELKPAPAAVKISLTGFFTVKKDFISPAAYRPVIRDRGGTYLKNCVFRI